MSFKAVGTPALNDVLLHLDDLPKDAWIYVERGPITAETPAFIQEYYKQPVPANTREFLSVSDIESVLSAWSEHRDGRKPTLAQAVRAVAWYFVEDGFLPEEADVDG